MESDESVPTPNSIHDESPYYITSAYFFGCFVCSVSWTISWKKIHICILNTNQITSRFEFQATKSMNVHVMRVSTSNFFTMLNTKWFQTHTTVNHLHFFLFHKRFYQATDLNLSNCHWSKRRPYSRLILAFLKLCFVVKFMNFSLVFFRIIC